MKPLVYAAGPISGLSYEGATHWRDLLATRLAPEIEVISPMRAKEYLENEISIAHSYDASILSCPKGIVTRDRFDTQRASAVVMNVLGASKVSIGTMIELGWADSARVPVIMVTEGESNPHHHGMVRELVGFMVPTVEDAAFIARAVLLANPGGAR